MDGEVRVSVCLREREEDILSWVPRETEKERKRDGEFDGEREIVRKTCRHKKEKLGWGCDMRKITTQCSTNSLSEFYFFLLNPLSVGF